MYIFNKISVWENASKEKGLFSKVFSKKISIGRNSNNKNKSYKHFINLIKTVVILLAVLLACSCGGGGGGGGMVAFAPSDGTTSLHNGGDSSGWGTGNQTGSGFNPQGQSIEESESGPLISQMAALDVSTVDIRLTINNVEQPLIVADETTPKSVLPKIKPGTMVHGSAVIHLKNGTTRTAYLDETEAQLNGALKFKVPYFYTCKKANGAIITSGEYFFSDGINLLNFMEGGIAGWQCTNDGSMHDGSHVTGVRGDITLVPYYGEGVPVLAGYIKTDLNSSTSYDIDETRTIDYASISGIEGGSLGYLIVTPLPSGTLFTETQSNNAISWSAYDVTVTIDGTPLSTISFMPSDSMAVKIDNIPLGSSISASAEIAVSGSTYTTLDTETATGTVMAGGGVTIYARYPIEYQVASAHASYASTTTSGTLYYTSSGTSALPAATNDSSVTPRVTETYTNNSTGRLMHFAGWARNASDTTPEITGDTIPSGYKGKLTLYAVYSELSVTLNASGFAPTSAVIIEGGSTLGMTATPDGFPDGAAITYTWEVIPDSAAVPGAVTPITVVGSGASATVSTVAGASGNAQVKVTATVAGTSLSATASKTVTVAVVTLPSTKTCSLDGSAETITASVAGYTGSNIEYTWNFSGSSVSVPNGQTGAGRTFTPVSGGKTTVTVGIRFVNENISLPAKTIDIYVFDINLSGTGLTAPTPPDTNYSLMMTTNDTAGKSITASLSGSGMPAVTYTWTCADSALNTIIMDDSGAASGTFTVKPKAAGTASFSVMAWYDGHVVASVTVNVSVAGIVFTTCPASLSMDAATSSCSVVAEVQGFSGTPTNWQWNPGSSGHVSFSNSSQIDSGTSSSITMNGLSGGPATISVSAVVNGITVSASKEVYILQLSLECADSSFTQPSGITQPNYTLMLANGETADTSITAALSGLPANDVTYEWTPTTSTKVDVDISGNVLKVKPKANVTGTESFTVKATYDGEYIEKTVEVIVAGLTLTGTDVIDFSSATPTTTLTLGTEGVNITDLSNVSYVSGTTSVANNPTAGADGCTVTALKGGETTITVTANANGKQLTATKTITVINLIVKDSTDSPVALTGNSLLTDSDSQMTLKARLEGLDASYSWSANPSGSTGKVSFDSSSLSATSLGTNSGSGTNATNNVTVTGWTPGTTSVTVTATYNSQTYTKTIAFSLSSELHEVDIDSLSSLLSGLGGSYRIDNPVRLKVTGLTADNWTRLQNITKNVKKYVDLSETQLPDGITDMEDAFKRNSYLIKAPKIPSSVTSLKNCFELCSNLIEMPDLSACTNLTNMRYAFWECYALAIVSPIPQNVENMCGCFQQCSALTGTIIVRSTKVTDWRDTFYDVTASQGVTVKVKSNSIKTDLRANGNNNGGVTVVVDSSI